MVKKRKKLIILVCITLLILIFGYSRIMHRHDVNNEIDNNDGLVEIESNNQVEGYVDNQMNEEDLR